MSPSSQELPSSTVKNIIHLCPVRPFSAAEILIHVFVTSRLDYCNSILYGTSSKVLNTLQYIQNSAACLHDRITPVLQNLHWLPVPYHIQLNNQAPSYLTNFLHRHTHSLAFVLLMPTSPPHHSESSTVTWGDRACVVYYYYCYYYYYYYH